MSRHVIIWVMSVLVTLAGSKRPKPGVVLWNEESPPAYAERAKEGELLKKEVPDFHSHFRFQFEWHRGKKTTEPSEAVRKEIALTQRIISEVFNPEVVPLESIGRQFRLVEKANLKGGKQDALVVRFRRGKYIMKVTKTIGKYSRIYVTVRLTSGKTFDLQQLWRTILNERIWPAKWEKPFYYAKLRRKSKVLRGGMWTARDSMRIDSSGKIVEPDSRFRVEDGPIGEGLYKRIDFYTNGRFATFQITGGARRYPFVYPGGSQSEANQGKE